MPTILAPTHPLATATPLTGGILQSGAVAGNGVEQPQDIGMELALAALTQTVGQVAVASGVPAPASIPSPAPLNQPPTPTIPRLGGASPTATLSQTEFGQIVYVCSDPQDDELCLMDGNGANQRQLTNNAVADYYPSLAPDGSFVVFARQMVAGSEAQYELYRVNVDGSGEQALTQNGSKNAAPAVSPDGKQLVFTSKLALDTHQIWLMNLDGSNLRQLTFDGANWDPTWSPDGQQIAFAGNRSGTVQLYVMDASGGNQRQLTQMAGIGGRSSWSPDGQSLVFYAGSRAERTRQIYRLDFPSLAVTAITSDGVSAGPCYSPFSRWLTYQTGGEVVIMRDDGTGLQVLTTNLNMDYQPRWGKK
jgi:TolB protein